jgi:hypothetical protein
MSYFDVRYTQIKINQSNLNQKAKRMILINSVKCIELQNKKMNSILIQNRNLLNDQYFHRSFHR